MLLDKEVCIKMIKNKPIIEKPSMTLVDYWYDFIRRVLVDLPILYLSSSGRKYVANSTMSVPGKVWRDGFSLSMSDLGYKEKGNKISLLKHIYFNSEAIEAARDKLITRVKKGQDFTSVVIPTMAGKKGLNSQGYCMNSIVITHILPKTIKGPGPLTYVTIFYRITEVIQKFGADLVFLTKLVIPEILPDNEYNITKVRFQFANAYFSALFLPVLYCLIDPVDILKEIEPKIKLPEYASLFRFCFKEVILPFMGKDPSLQKYRVRKRMHLLSLKHIKDKTFNVDNLKAFISQQGLEPYMANLVRLQQRRIDKERRRKKTNAYI